MSHMLMGSIQYLQQTQQTFPLLPRYQTGYDMPLGDGSQSSTTTCISDEEQCGLQVPDVPLHLIKTRSHEVPHSPDASTTGEWIASSEGWTTVMLRNLPACFSRGRLIYLLAKEGFAGTFDFLYVPLCFREKVSLCYAFINFLDVDTVARFWKHFCGFKNWGLPSAHVAEVCWCARHQGLSEAIAYYQNNSVMHPSVPDECKPVLFYKGSRTFFPAPTKRIKVPKKVKQTEDDGATSQDRQLLNGNSLGAGPLLTLSL
ncbi:ML3 [Symbiodinium necroappetens]|uniref:ML3 protein n=1 Tax=Symbiodinium necroappetens TaxID=1628268 RepID=A0A812PZE5_9DINO|nr:ML3 [Symbiodinium necroappetens]